MYDDGGDRNRLKFTLHFQPAGLPAFALVLNLDLILAGFGRGRRKILLFPDEIVLKGLFSFIAVGLSLQNRHSKSKLFERRCAILSIRLGEFHLLILLGNEEISPP